MKKTLFSLSFGLLIVGANLDLNAIKVGNSEMHRSRPLNTEQTSAHDQIHRLASLAYRMTCGLDEEAIKKAKTRLSHKADQKVAPMVLSKPGIGINAKKPRSYTPQASFDSGLYSAGFFWDICGIQKHAIKAYAQSRSWFEKHPFQFATLAGFAGIGAGWGLKTFWETKSK